MTIQEFSNEFDVLYNNIMSNNAPGLNEYEKSVFLTKAQDEIIKAYFSPTTNKSQEGFDGSAKRQIDFSKIMNTEIISKKLSPYLFDPRAIAFQLPSELFISVNEQLVVGNNIYQIVPLSYSEYTRLMSKPYKYPVKNQAWRLITRNPSVNAAPATVTQNCLDTSLFTNLLTIVSNYGKPVRFIVKSVGSASTIVGDPPVVEESSTLVTITCNIIKNTSSAPYWSKFLNNSQASANGPDITPYVGDFSGESGHSIFPAFTIPDKVETLFDVTNSGGNAEGTSTFVEIIGRFPSNDVSYRIRYIRRPRPIVLIDLSEINVGLSIQKVSTPSECELPEELHTEILQRAVELAKAAYSGDLQSQLVLGQASATNMGIVTRQ